MALGLTGLLAVVYTNRGAQKLNRMDLPIRGLNLHLVRLNFAVSSITLNHSGRTGRPCRCYAQHFTFFNKYFKGWDLLLTHSQGAALLVPLRLQP